MFVIDTDHLTILQRRTQPEYGRLRARMDRFSLGDFFVAVVTFHEQALGANKYISQARTQADVIRGYAMLQRLLTDFEAAQVLSFDQASATVFNDGRSQGIRIATMDLRIGAITVANDKTLLTRNSRDFSKMTRLRIEDWTV